MKIKKTKNRKLLAIGCIALIVISMFSMTTFASSAWYAPNESLTPLTANPNASSYWIEVEYYLDGQKYSYSTQGADSATANVNRLGDDFVNFGSTSYDVVQYNKGAWRIRLASGDVTPISHTDIKIKLYVLDETQITDFISWFDENFTVVSMSHGNILTEFVQTLVGGIGELASGIGTGVNGFVQDLFLKVNESGAVEGLSTFGGVTAIFGGIALAVGLTTLIFNWIKSIGK